MSGSYYVIELSARWLTVLLVALALVMVLAFALGYGAAWSVLSSERVEPGMSALAAAATPTEIPEVVIPTPVPAEAAATPTATPEPTLTPAPEPTRAPTPRPSPTAVPATDFYVQVLASSHLEAVEEARTKLAGLGFPSDNHRVISDGGAATLYKLQIGPFPDRSSADRVAQRMSASGFPDAWVVAP